MNNWKCLECNSFIHREHRAGLRCSCGNSDEDMFLMWFGTPKGEALKILENPNLFNEITEQEFDKKIVGEVESRKVIFLCGAGGRLIQNCQVASYNVLVNDEAGSGKDYITGKVLELIPKEFYIHKTRISPTVFTYWHNADKEPEWTWDGKVFYPEDISEIVLNSDVFKVMCSSGSSATIIVRQQAVDLEIVGKPVMITTTATATPNPELTRRFVILTLDSSEAQTKAIMKRHCEFAKTGIIPEYNKKYTDAMKYLKRVNIRIPFAELLSEVLPAKSIIMRTHLPRFLDYIKASAGFHQFQRKVQEGFILAEGQDYDIARECFLKLCSNRYMIPLTINQKRILEAFERNQDKKYSVTQFHAENNIMTDKALMTNFGLLSKYGLLETTISQDSYGRDMEVYGLSKNYNPNEKIIIPTYEELCRITTTSKTSKTSNVSNVSKVSNFKGDALLAVDVIPNLHKNKVHNLPKSDVINSGSSLMSQNKVSEVSDISESKNPFEVKE